LVKFSNISGDTCLQQYKLWSYFLMAHTHFLLPDHGLAGTCKFFILLILSFRCDFQAGDLAARRC